MLINIVFGVDKNVCEIFEFNVISLFNLLVIFFFKLFDILVMFEEGKVKLKINNNERFKF